MVKRCHVELLVSLIQDAGLEKKSAYSVGDTAKILNVSVNTIRKMCDEWEGDGAKSEALRCYRFGIKHERRIPHTDLEAWLARNDGFEVSCR